MKPLVSGALPFDWWTLAHAAGGVALAMLGIGVWWTFAILVGFEGLEWSLRALSLGAGPLFEFESLSNIIADVFVAVVGYVAVLAVLRSQGYRLHWTRRMRKWAM